MPRGSASRDLDRRERSKFVLRDVHFFEIHLAGIERDSALHRITNGPWLLVNLFEHEVLEAALLCHDRVPGDPLLLRLDQIAVKIGYANTVFRKHRELFITEEKDVACVGQDRGDVRRDKELAVAKTDDYRRPFTYRHDRVRLIDRYDRHRENAAKLFRSLSHRFFEREVFSVLVMTDQVSNDLSVSLGLKFMKKRLFSLVYI